MRQSTEKRPPFSERHPRLNLLIGLISIFVLAYFALYLIRLIIKFLINILSILSSLDAVVIVALITGALSIVGIVISKIIDYKKSRQEYLAQKREVPYADFIEMIYNLLNNIKNPGSYTEQMMVEDLSKFSKQITLWGSSGVVKQWVKFRITAVSSDAGVNNLVRLEKIMNEMRRDLGLKKTKQGNLLSFFITDIKTVLKNK